MSNDASGAGELLGVRRRRSGRSSRAPRRSRAAESTRSLRSTHVQLRARGREELRHRAVAAAHVDDVPEAHQPDHARARATPTCVRATSAAPSPRPPRRAIRAARSRARTTLAARAPVVLEERVADLPLHELPDLARRQRHRAVVERVERRGARPCGRAPAPASRSLPRCVDTLDCASCVTATISATVSSCAARSASRRTRVGSPTS